MAPDRDHGECGRVEKNSTHPVGYAQPPKWLRSLGLSGIQAGLASYAATLAGINHGQVNRSPETSLESLIQQACEHLVGQLGVYNIWIALLDGRDVIALASSFRHGFSALRQQLLDGICPHCMQQVLQSEGVVVIEDPHSACGECPLANSYHGRVGMAMRLEDQSKILGIVCASVPDVMAEDGDLRARMQAEVASLSRNVAAIMEREEWIRTEAMVHSIYRAAPVGIGLIRDGQICEVNDMLCEMTGRSRKELIGASFSSLFNRSEEARRVNEWMAAVTRREAQASIETTWCRRDGVVRSIRIGVTPLDLADPGKGITFTALDITSQQESERNLQESRRLLASLMDSLPGMAYRCRFDDHWTMEFVSKGFRELTGYEPEDVLGNRRISFAVIIHPDDRARVYQDVSDTTGRNSFTLEYRINRADGETRWVWERGRVVPQADGGVPMVEGFIIDITDRKKLTEHILQISKTESLGVMAGGIAHDFNNILAVMVGNAEQGLTYSGDQPQLRSCLEKIAASGARASELCRQLLSFCGNRYQDVVVQLNDLITSMLPLLQTSVGAGTEIRVRLAGSPSSVNADAVELRQLLVQLVNNAAESYPDHRGVVEIVTGECLGNAPLMDQAVDPVPSTDGRWVWIKVVDHGCGITDDIRQRMFDPFFSTKFTGRGMGLAAVRGVVKAHKGFITVDTAPGKGTAMTIYLPAASAPARPPPPVRSARRGKVNTAMVVDDESALRELVGFMLESEGVKTFFAEDGLQALDLFREHADEIDLVVMDLTMPGLDGIEAAMRMREIRPDVRIVIATGYSAEDITNRCDAQQIDGILLKPFSRADLARFLNSQKPV